MPTITAITPSKDHPDRAVVRVDGRPVVTLPRHILEQLALHVGQPWDAQLAEQVAAAAEYDKAVRAGAAMVARRALSDAELRLKLARRGFGPTILASAVDRLRALGLIDDAKLGRALIEEISARKVVGPRLLAAKLQRRGLGEALIEQLVSDAAAPTGPDRSGEGASALPLERAEALARETLATMVGLDRATRLRRLAGLLARRGFDADTVEQVIEQLGDED